MHLSNLDSAFKTQRQALEGITHCNNRSVALHPRLYTRGKPQDGEDLWSRNITAPDSFSNKKLTVVDYIACIQSSFHLNDHIWQFIRFPAGLCSKDNASVAQHGRRAGCRYPLLLSPHGGVDAFAVLQNMPM